MDRRRLHRALLVVTASLALSCGARQTTSDESAVVELPTKEGGRTTQRDAPVVIITVKPEGVGDHFEHTGQSEHSGEIKARGEAVRIREVVKIRYAVDILAVDDTRTLKQRVRYLEFEKVNDPTPAKPASAPVVNKAYVIERQGDALVVTDDSGAPVTGGELEYMQRTWRRFGKPKEVRGALARARIQVGEELPDLAAAYAADYSDEETKLKAVSMRLRETRGDVAIFDYALEGAFSGVMKGAVMKLTGTRELSISTGEQLKDRGTMTIEGGSLETGLSFKLKGMGSETALKL